MSSLLAQVVPLAFAAAISPVVFLLQLNTLTGPRPLARGSALTAGAAIVLIVGSTLGVALGGTGFSERETLQAAINIAFGVLLVLVGLRALLRPPSPSRPTRDEADERGPFLPRGRGRHGVERDDVRALHPGARADRGKRAAPRSEGASPGSSSC